MRGGQRQGQERGPRPGARAAAALHTLPAIQVEGDLQRGLPEPRDPGAAGDGRQGIQLQCGGRRLHRAEEEPLPAELLRGGGGRGGARPGHH